MSRSVDRFTKNYHICIDRKGDRISEVFILTTGQKKRVCYYRNSLFWKFAINDRNIKNIFSYLFHIVLSHCRFNGFNNTCCNFIRISSRVRPTIFKVALPTSVYSSKRNADRCSAIRNTI